MKQNVLGRCPIDKVPTTPAQWIRVRQLAKTGLCQRTWRSWAVYESIGKISRGKTSEVLVSLQPSPQFFTPRSPKGCFWALLGAHVTAANKWRTGKLRSASSHFFRFQITISLKCRIFHPRPGFEKRPEGNCRGEQGEGGDPGGCWRKVLEKYWDEDTFCHRWVSGWYITFHLKSHIGNFHI